MDYSRLMMTSNKPALPQFFKRPENICGLIFSKSGFMACEERIHDEETDRGYANILVDQEGERLILLPCLKNDRASVRIYVGAEIPASGFCRKLYEVMGWEPDSHYIAPHVELEAGDGRMLFDLSAAITCEPGRIRLDEYEIVKREMFSRKRENHGRRSADGSIKESCEEQAAFRERQEADAAFQGIPG